jgi:glutamine---fructose-6-phosphate transaminase (isomerizing)
VTPFELDISAQGAALRGTIAYYEGEGAAALTAARDLAAGAPLVAFVAMGSSLSASHPAAEILGAIRPAAAFEAGELLHYGLDRLDPGALVVLTSQSGRSVELVAVAERLRARPGARLVAVTNDPASPMASLADLVLPMLAGAEATVATKTYVTSTVVLTALARTLATGSASGVLPALALTSVMDAIAGDPELGVGAAADFADVGSLAVIARGPALVAADYGALILKETVALAAQPLAGGSFRHGPMEIAGPAVGVVMLAPTGRTHGLCIAMAQEIASLGSPVWLIGDDATALPGSTERLRVTTLPAVDEAETPLTMSVPIQRLAAAMARARGREPGVLLRSQKVTDRE